MIVDASVAIKWIVVEEASEAASSLIGLQTLRTPTLFLSEVGNALWRKSRLGEIDPDTDLAGFIESLLNIVAIESEIELMPRALAIAVELDHPIYDCVYLALAEALDDVVVTADARFVTKVPETAFAPLVRSLA